MWWILQKERVSQIRSEIRPKRMNQMFWKQPNTRKCHKKDLHTSTEEVQIYVLCWWVHKHSC
jgi:hypothetical protein